MYLRHKNYLLTLSFILFFITSLFSQDSFKYQIKGNVYDEENRSLEFVNIILLNKIDSSFVKGTTTNIKGNYSIENITPNNYILQFSHVSYKTIEQEINLKKREDLILNQVLESNSLDEVVITSNKQAIKIDADKIIFDMKNSTASEGSTAIELLRDIPTVIIDNDGNISLAGKNKISLVINGKLINLSNEDIERTLNSISGGDIEKIEVINNPSSKYDAVSGSGLINIKTKKNKGDGFNLNVNSNWSYGRRPKLNSGTRASYSSNKFSVWGGYIYSDNKFSEDLELNRFIIDEDESWSFIQRVNQNQEFKTNSLNTGIEYKINKNQGVELNYDFKDSKDKYNPSGNTVILIDNIFDSTFNSGNNQDVNWEQHLGSLIYKINMKNNSSLSSTFSYLNNKELSYALTNQDINQNIITENEITSAIKISTAKIDYFLPIKEDLNFETGIKLSGVDTSLLTTTETISGNDNFFDRFSDFDYKENVLGLYVNTSFNINKMKARIGLRFEHTNLKNSLNTLSQNTVVNNDYSDFFPNISLNYLKGNHSINFDFSRSIIRPNYANLNPFEFYLDRFTKISGNPQLSPQYTYNYSISDTYKKINFSINYINDKNMLNRLAKQNIISKEENYKYENIDLSKRISLNISFPFKINNWWNSINTFSTYYDDYQISLLDFPTSISGYGLYSQTQHTFKIADGFSSNFALKYLSPQISRGGLYNLDYRFSTRIGFSKKMFNNLAVVKVNFTDVFNTDKFSGLVGPVNNRVQIYSKWETQQIQLSFSYQISGNKDKVKYNNKNEGIKEELKRIDN